MAGFRFKQFAIEQERSAMKVGTDGVLLGAWADVRHSDERILDVGSGTGLVALMAAQRSAEWGAVVEAVEIDPASAQDAEANFAASPWAERLNINICPVQEFEAEEPFDHILSNPPYFVDSLTSPDAGRTTARHTTTLRFEELTRHAARLLSPEGRLTVVIPTAAVADMTLAAARAGLMTTRRCDVQSKPTAKAIRSLVEFGRRSAPTMRTTLTIHTPDGDFTPEYRNLTKDFYLKF